MSEYLLCEFQIGNLALSLSSLPLSIRSRDCLLILNQQACPLPRFTFDPIQFSHPQNNSRRAGVMNGRSRDGSCDDPFLSRYDPSELRVAAEFLTCWLPFLSADLCRDCARTLSHRIRSVDPGADSDSKTPEPSEMAFAVTTPDVKPSNPNYAQSSGGRSCRAEVNLVCSLQERSDTGFLGFRSFRMALEASVDSEARKTQAAKALRPQASFADMEEETELKEEESQGSDMELLDSEISCSSPSAERRELSREQKEYIRFMDVKRNKELVLFEWVKGRRINILEGLELHTKVFNAAEQKRIVEFVYELQDMGRRGQLKDRTYTAPAKWMRGKGRETIQFGCCYNYAVDKYGNPPGILHEESVDPLPSLFKKMIRRLVRWHILPPTCVPDSCIVNIYEEGDCIPPHIDNHDFVRPFCTISFLSECKILFGSMLKVIAPGEFAGPFELPLPVGSVLVLSGNGADVAKHCVPAVPMKRISITFRRMDESKQPLNYCQEPDLLGIEPLPYEVKEPRVQSLLSTPDSQTRSRLHGSEADSGRRWSSVGSNGYSGDRSSGRTRRDSSYGWRSRKNYDS